MHLRWLADSTIGVLADSQLQKRYINKCSQNSEVRSISDFMFPMTHTENTSWIQKFKIQNSEGRPFHIFLFPMTHTENKSWIQKFKIQNSEGEPFQILCFPWLTLKIHHEFKNSKSKIQKADLFKFYVSHDSHWKYIMNSKIQNPKFKRRTFSNFIFPMTHTENTPWIQKFKIQNSEGGPFHIFCFPWLTQKIHHEFKN
jgi:hypothetical protein